MAFPVLPKQCFGVCVDHLYFITQVTENYSRANVATDNKADDNVDEDDEDDDDDDNDDDDDLEPVEELEEGGAPGWNFSDPELLLTTNFGPTTKLVGITQTTANIILYHHILAIYHVRVLWRFCLSEGSLERGRGGAVD